jgi:NAD(P)-dependent dehydrogenase (short-subunit alcohol dehydrogenase family)
LPVDVRDIWSLGFNQAEGTMATIKSVVVTGVSSGIGLATAQRLVASGYQVFGSVRKEETGVSIQKTLGSNFVPLLFDVTDEKAISKARDDVAKVLAGEPLFGLVNNAGIAVHGPLELLSIAEFRKQLETNLVGPLLVTQAFLPFLGATKDFNGVPGRIVNISSVAGRLSLPFLGPYAVSKHGMEAFSDALRRELMVWGIDVVVIAPGAVATPIWDKAEEAEYGAVAGTVYEAPADRLKKWMIAGGRVGLNPSVIAGTIEKALTVNKPRARYTLLKNFIAGWLVPVSLPKRALDKTISKSIGLKREGKE